MYFRGLNKILACLVCIINIVMFEFQIQTISFYSNQAFWHLCCNPTKFTFVKTKAIENCGEFIRFFLEGLNPFKIQRRFKFESVLGFVT
jgi:hypothetical protein